MEDDFDVSAAVESIGSGLGFEPDADDGEVNLEVTLPEGKKEENPAPAGTAAAPAEGTANPAEGTPAPATPTAAEDPTAAPPRTWRAEAGAQWANLPPEVRAEIHKREADIFKGIEGYKQDASIGKSIRAAVDPYVGFLRTAGIQPMDAITGLLQTHHTLATGTAEQKQQLFQKMAKSYGIELGQSNPDNAPYIDPTVANLQKQLETVQSELAEARNVRIEQTRAGVRSEVDTFAKDPANSYFDEVSNEVATLLQRGLASTLREAYDKAIYLNPAVRAKVIAAQQQTEAQRQATEQAARVAKVKEATAANVKARSRSGSAATPLGTIDDTISATLAAIKGRS